MLLYPVPTGIEPAKRNYFPTDYELILHLFGCISCKDWPVLFGVTEKVKQFMGDLLKVETIVHLCLQLLQGIRFNL
jgi:hypothetical protein